MRVVVCLVFCFAAMLTHAQDTPDVALWREAMHHQGRNDLDKAIPKIKEAIALNPRDASYYSLLSTCYVGIKDYDNALKAVDKAIDTYSKWSDSRRIDLVKKGVIIDAQGKHKEAALYFESLFPEFEDYFQAYYLNFEYGETLLKLGRFEEAEKAYIRSLKIYFYNNRCQLRLAELKEKKHEKLQTLLPSYMYLCIGGPPEGVEWAKKNVLPVDSITKSTWTRFVADSEALFKDLTTMEPTEKDLKDPFQDIYFTKYIPFFTDLYKSGHSEAFCSYLFVGAGLKFDEAKMKTFYDWLDPYRRK